VIRDQNLRSDTSVDKLARLTPVFGKGQDATMTEGNCTPLTDGASVVLLASTVLVTLAAWQSDKFCRDRLGLDAPLGSIDRSRLNVNGSSLAAGHPFAATGGRIVASLANLLSERGSGRGLISICAAGGQGVVAILEAI
jgi:acetyl-CoA acetyltransferase